MPRPALIVLAGVVISLTAGPACSSRSRSDSRPGGPPLPPEVTDVAPPYGYGTTTTAVVITGSGLTGALSVALDDPAPTLLAGVTVVSDAEIQATVPAGIAQGIWNVQVTTPVGTNATSTPRFRVVGLPTVVDVSPDNGLDNVTTSVTIGGAEFIGVTGVGLDDPASTALGAVTTVNDSTITADVPPGIAPGIYNVQVTTGAGTNPTSQVRFRVFSASTPPPTVTAITPDTGMNVGPTPVTIDGTDFVGTVTARLEDPGATALTGITVVSPSLLTATVPPGIALGAWEVRVTADGGTSAVAGVTFDVTGIYTGPAIYVSRPDTDEVLVINLNTLVVEASIPVGLLPSDLAITPDEREIYVANSGGNTVSVIETATNTVVDTVLVGAGPNAVDITPVTGAEVYVSNGAASSVTVIDVATRTAGPTIAVAADPDELEFRRPQGDEVWVLTSGPVDAALDPVQVIDTASRTVVATIADVGINPLGITFDQSGDTAYVGNTGSPPVSLGDIREIAVATRTPTNRIAASLPMEIARVPGSDKAYFSEAMSSQLFLLDTSTGTVLPGSIPLSGASPSIPGGRFGFAPGTGDAFVLEGSGMNLSFNLYRVDTIGDLTVPPPLSLGPMNSPPIGVVVKEN